MDRVIAPARRYRVRARAPPESLGGREEGSLSASTSLAAGVPNPAYSARRSLRRVSRRRGGARLCRSGAAFVPANGLYGFQGAIYAIAAHKICVWQKVDRLGLFQGFAWGQREWVELVTIPYISFAFAEDTPQWVPSTISIPLCCSISANVFIVGHNTPVSCLTVQTPR